MFFFPEFFSLEFGRLFLRICLLFLGLRCSFDLLFLLNSGNYLNRFDPISELSKLSNEEAIHVVYMWVDPLCQAQRWVESFLFE